MNITVLSRQTCAPCVQLKKFLDYKKISYSVVDIDENPERLGNYLQVPITIIEKDNTTNVVEGYNLQRLVSLL